MCGNGFISFVEQEVIAQKIETTKKLFDLLKTTSDYERLVSLTYVRGAAATPYSEAVIAEWDNGMRGAINVGMDSPYALIKDVCHKIDQTRYAE